MYGVLPPKSMVLEFVDGGNLFDLLHPEEGGKPPLNPSDLPWSTRLNIALDIASGLEYLQSITPPIVHRDFRSPNIFVSIFSKISYL